MLSLPRPVDPGTISAVALGPRLEDDERRRAPWWILN
jgi:hypothetical protein